MKKKFDIEKLGQTETSVSSFVDSPIKKSATRRKELEVDKVFKEMKTNPFRFYIRVP